MRHYRAFGGVLRSEIEFPELSQADAVSRPDWAFVVEPGEPPLVPLSELGERQVRQERYQLWRSPHGYRLTYSHAGTFDISNDGTLIWYHDESSIIELVRSIVLGPAIALALELAGHFCLHGSAVALAEGAVAFLGPKYYGKSTLAMALTAAGGRLLGDDLLVVRPGPPPTVRPGVASVRLWPDVAAALPLGSVCDTLIPGVKTTVTGFADEALASSPCRLKAIYNLAPFGNDRDARTAWRERLEPLEATIALAHQTKLPDSLIGMQAAGQQLAMAVAMATSVPVWKLHIVRDVGKLDQVVRQIIDWSPVE